MPCVSKFCIPLERGTEKYIDIASEEGVPEMYIDELQKLIPELLQTLNSEGKDGSLWLRTNYSSLTI